MEAKLKMITILHTTGYPTVTRDGNRLTFKTRFDLALLLYLALATGVHGRDTLAKLLWPAVDRERALNALRLRALRITWLVAIENAQRRQRL